VNSGDVNNAIGEYMQVQFGWMKGKFNMDVTGTFRDCLTRQGDEGVRVKEAENNEF
jgi:hypothetical protein